MRFLIHTINAPSYLHVIYLDRPDPEVEHQESNSQKDGGHTDGLARAQVVTRPLHGLADFSIGECSIDGQGTVYAVAVTSEKELEAWVLDWIFDEETADVEFDRRTFAPVLLGSRKLGPEN